MASTYENDLRLEEMATGENSGSWGTKTNTNLELIADAFSYGTEIIADADTTIEIQDGAADAARSLALKINSSEDLTTTRVITLGPNTTSKVWIIENSTSGGEALTISAGSGSNITLANGTTKIIATDGIGAGSNVVELTQDLAIADLFVDDDLTVGDDIIMDSDGGILKIGADADLQVTHSGTAGTITNATGDLTVDVAGDIILDADGGEIFFKDGGASTGKIRMDDGDLQIRSLINDKNLTLEGNDDGSIIAALTLDMSEAGAATFNAGVTLSGDLTVDTDTLYVDSSNNRVGINTASPSFPLDVSTNSSTTNDAVTTLRLSANTTGTAANNFGASINFSGEDASGSLRDLSTINAIYTDATNRSSALTFKTRANLGTLTEAMRIDQGQRVLIGYTANTSVADFNAGLQVVGQGTSDYHGAAISAVGFSNNSNGAYLNFASGRSNTAGTFTSVADDDTLGQINFAAADGTDMSSRAALIMAQIDGAPSANDTPGRIIFSTTASGASSPTERMRITSDAKVSINKSNPSYTLEVQTFGTNDGDMRVGGSSGNTATGLSFDYSNSGTTAATIQNNYATSSGSALLTIGSGKTDFKTGTSQSLRLRIDDGGEVLIGGQTTPRTTFATTTSGGVQLSVEGTSANNTKVASVRNVDGVNGPYLVLGHSRASAVNGVTVLAESDHLGTLSFQGGDGTGLREGANIRAEVDGALSGGGAADMPGRLIFSTTSDGAGAVTERFRIDSGGNATFKTGGMNIKFPYNSTTSYSGNLGWQHVQFGNNGANRIVAGNTTTGGDFEFIVNNTVDLSTNNSISHNGLLAMIIHSGGNIEMHTPNSAVGLYINNTNHDSIVQIQASAAGKNSVIRFADGDDADVGMIDYDHATNSFATTVNASERTRITSDGVFQATQYGIGGTGTDTVGLMRTKNTSASTLNFDFIVDVDTGSWTPLSFYITVGSIGSGASKPRSAYFVIRAGTYNGQLGSIGVAASIGDTSDVSVALSDQGGLDPMTVRVAISHPNNRVTATVLAQGYMGIQRCD